MRRKFFLIKIYKKIYIFNLFFKIRVCQLTVVLQEKKLKNPLLGFFYKTPKIFSLTKLT